MVFIIDFKFNMDNLSSISLIMKKEGFFGSEEDLLNSVANENG